MKVFITWSGELSKQVASLLKDWIPDVLQGTETWISTEDIEKGSLWFGDISKQLGETGIGILCLTQENISAPWVLFEAGALSKGLDTNRVCPLLVNLNHSDLKPPLSQFNGTLPVKADMLKLIQTINAQNREKTLPPERVQKAFDQWWHEFESKFLNVLANYKPAKEALRRSQHDMVEETLEVARSIQKMVREMSEKSPPLTSPFLQMPNVLSHMSSLEDMLVRDEVKRRLAQATLSGVPGVLAVDLDDPKGRVDS